MLPITILHHNTLCCSCAVRFALVLDALLRFSQSMVASSRPRGMPSLLNGLRN